MINANTIATIKPTHAPTIKSLFASFSPQATKLIPAGNSYCSANAIN